MKSSLSILVLAAGVGSRMKSELPKVLHPVVGRPLVEHILAATAALHPDRTAIVLGVGRERVQQTLRDRGWTSLEIVIQDKPKGSGHAVLQARSWLRRQKGTLLVVYGDTPLLTTETLHHLVQVHQKSRHAATFLTMDIPNPAGYGRMILDNQGLVSRIVEDKDANDEERRVTLVNSGVACWDIQSLLGVLEDLKPNNVKHEYYLTDAAALLRAQGLPVGIHTVYNADETHGVNTRVDLAKAETLWRERILHKWMLAGVSIVDPHTTYIDWNVSIGSDTRIGPGVVIQGASQIGEHCEIGPYTMIESSILQDGVKIGPFAHLRPQSVLEANVHIGNFVEVKKSRIGRGSKANHLTYLGDAQIGSGVNVGAGTITCNYDGVAKHSTLIENDVFIGSNANLVAPVRIGRGAIIGAGSTITQDIPADALGLERSQQLVKMSWAKQWRKRYLKGKKSRS